jgi:diacylglycerol O-acyltransferase / wax synthase
VGGALGRVLAGRGEPVGALAVAVPVAGRRSTRPARLGNEVAPLVVDVPVTGDPVHRLGKVHDAVCAHREEATGPPPIAVLGPVFRAMAALGGYRWYMNHQHRLHTLVSYVRGPEQPLAFAGATVTRVVPMAVAEAGNVTVNFVALSYAGTLTVTAVADPDHFPDLASLAEGVRAELALLTPGGTTELPLPASMR